MAAVLSNVLSNIASAALSSVVPGVSSSGASCAASSAASPTTSSAVAVPKQIHQQLWRADQLGNTTVAAHPSRFPELDSRWAC